MSAGVAHEINTPIQYITDNIEFLEQSIQSYVSVLEDLKTINAQEDRADTAHKHTINRLNEEDFDFMNHESPLAIQQSKEGLNRINSIIKAMKSFSHSNHGHKLVVDINEAITTTITIAHAASKNDAIIEAQLEPELPHLSCYRDELNQVILNMIVNATHSIKDRFHGSDSVQGKIHITTQLENNMVVIQISDNGKGIPEGIKTKIFDPFFTTKEVGKGSGQGLYFAYQIIVEKHQGLISVHSTENQGATFEIRLPIE
ncbi:ATP-binding protein [Vibrio sp.]|nr:ATP-binding protein [Vibrio sp.]